MKNFSLTHPEPRAPRRRGNSAHWESEAVTHWLDAQTVSHDLDAACAAGATLDRRLLDGDLWLRRHDADHPKADAARRLHNRLVSEQRISIAVQKALYVRCWLCVCATHGALNQVDDPDGWLAANAPGVTANMPQAIWHAVQPNRSPPFQTFLPPVEAYYVEHGFETQAQLNAWMTRKDVGR